MKITLFALLGSLVVIGCGDNSGTGAPVDARGSADARLVDAPDVDAPLIDAPQVDAPSASNIEAVLASPDGTGLSLPISATVTYIKPQIGSTTNDPAGFNVQATKAGAALFVAVDPTSLTPVPVAGDVVTFTVTDLGTVGMSRRVTAVTNFVRTSQGANLATIVTDISATADVVAMVAAYDAKLVTVTGTAATAFSSGGTGFQKTNITTTGVTAVDPNYQLRIPADIIDAQDIVMSCAITATKVPVLRFNAAAEIVAYRAEDLTMTGCPAPTVMMATPLSATSVKISLTRHPALATVLVDGTGITFDNGLTATAAVIVGRDIVVTTSAQTPGTTYTATVAGTVTDLQGTALGMPETATFDGYSMPASVEINELNAHIAGGCDLIELRVMAGGTLAGFKIQERIGGTGHLAFTFPSLAVQTNDLVMVHLNSGSLTCNPGGATSETTKTGQAAAMFAGNYDTAYDFWNDDAGLTDTDNVFTLYDATGAIHDVLFASDDPAGLTAAGDTETQAALVGAASQWSPVLATYIDTVFRINAADDLNMTGTTAADTSMQRLGDLDTNAKTDWTTGAGAASTWGALNVGQTALP